MSGASPQTGAAGETGSGRGASGCGGTGGGGVRERRGLPVTWRMENLRYARVTLKEFESPAPAGGMPGTDDKTLRAKRAPQRGWKEIEGSLQKLLGKRAAAP